MELRALPHWEKFAPKRSAQEGESPAPDIFGELLAKHGAVAVDLLRSTLQLDPHLRISAQDVLEHRFFAQEPLPCQPHEIKINAHLSCHELDVKRHRERLREEKEAQRLQNRRPAAGQAAGGAAQEENPASPKR